METQGSSTFLNQLGFGWFDLGYLLIVVAVLAVIMLIVIILLINQMLKVNRLKKRLNRFLLGNDGSSLEQEIIGLFEDNKFLKNASEKNQRDIQALFKRMESVYQKMGLVKYDAFQHMGGQLSYSLALLDENNNGFIINSVHSTEGCYSYSKEIRSNDTNITLSKEEAEALAIAKQKNP